MPNRLSRGPYLGLWALLLAGQIGALYALLPVSAPLAIVLALLLQVAKVPVSTARLDDIGLAKDDAILVFVPIGNVALWWQLLGPTPADAARERLRSQWVGQIGALKAFWMGLKAVGSTPVALVIATVAGTLTALLDRGVLAGFTRLASGTPEQVELAQQFFGGAVLFLGAYTSVQLARRATVSRASWLPVFLLPVPVFGYLTLKVVTDEALFGNPLIPVLTSDATWRLAWSCVVGASLAVVWVHVAVAQHEGRTLGFGEALRQVARRTADVTAPHGAATLAIFIGMQVVIPGIYYALQYAFVDATAVLDPTAPALKQSTDMSRGIRRRLFKVYALAIAGQLALSAAACIAVELVTTKGATFGDAASTAAYSLGLQMLGMPVDDLALVTLILMGIVGELLFGAAAVGFAHMYRERLARSQAA